MAAQRHGMPTWLDAYPVETTSRHLNPEEPLFVDVGGGLGHQCIALRQRFPQLSGKVILQDIPQTLAHAIHHDKVEIQEQDFFEPQAVKGAEPSQAYLLHTLLCIPPFTKRSEKLTSAHTRCHVLLYA